MPAGLRFGAGPLRVYVPLTGRKRRKKKPMKLPQTRGQWIGFGIILAVIVGFGVTHANDKPPAPTVGNVQIINRTTYTGTQPWPLTVDQVTAACTDQKLTFQAGTSPEQYSIAPQPGDGTLNLNLITTKQAGAPDGMMSVRGLLDQAEKLC